MAETLPNNNPERAPTPERPTEQLEVYTHVETQSEQTVEQAGIENGEKAAEKAKIEALDQAVSIEQGSAEKKHKEPTGSPATKRRHGVVSKKERTASFNQHMKHVQKELPPVKRAFSKLIHNPVVEKTSEVVGSTVARPNAILAGAVVAFVAVLAVYLVAKHFGYRLSGFETIAAFCIGWLLGIAYDFLKVLFTGKRSS